MNATRNITRHAMLLRGAASLAVLGLTVSAHAQTPPAGTVNVFSSGDAIFSSGSSPNEGAGEGVRNAIDGSIYDKYLNFQSQNSGFVDTPVFGAASGGTVVTALQLATANDASERDPLTFNLLGSNNGGVTFTQIASGSTGLDAVYSRNTYGSVVTFANTTAYKTYKILFPTVRNYYSANSMQVADVALYGVAAPAVTPAPEPSGVAAFAFVALGAAGLALKARKRNAAA